MKLSKKHLGILYQLVVESSGKARENPIDYNQTLVELEQIIHKELNKQSDI